LTGFTMKEYAVRRPAEGIFERGFKPFKQFNRYAPFNPPPLSSPATRGRMKEGA